MRIILFDVDGVLIHGYHARPELRRCWDKNLERDFNISRDRFTREFIQGPFVHSVLTGKQDLKSALARFLPTLGHTGDPEALIRYWLENDSCINTDLIEKIKTLKSSKKTRLFIATNQEHNRAQYLMKNLSFSDYFDDIFHSARIGHLKPNREYFDFIVKNLACEQEEPPIFFDDTPDVVLAAKKCGWQAYEYKNTDSLLENPFVREILTTQTPKHAPPAIVHFSSGAEGKN